MEEIVQILGVADRLFPLIQNGEKTSTIRWREQHIGPGPLRFVCDGDSRQLIDVDVLRCTEMPLSEVASFVGRVEQWPEDVMLEGMREHYPTIEFSSVVQVVEFALPQ